MVLESNTLDLLFVKDGEQGTDGKMLYTWIKYAKDDKGTDMTDDPQSAVYIGISYNNESNVESDDPTQYAWTKIQGADGKKGEDAYTIVLENENISFATDENRNPLSEQAYTSRITVMKGATPVTDFGIGDIAKTQGIAIAKGDDGISISVVNGNALPADSGEITVPISVGGTVFKKVLTWTCAKKGEQGVKGDKGDTGQKGQDGTSVKITSKSVTYQTSTSGTTAPTGTWSTTVPTVNNGQYLWTKTTVQYSDGNKTEAYSVSYKGTNGTNGTSVTVSKTEITYQVSTSGTTAPTGTWSTTMPSCDQGQYLWTKTYVKYSDGKDTTSYSVSYKGVDGEKFAFNMLRETNQGSKHWENHASGGKYSTESIITEDGINAVKLICTEAIPSGGWQYVSFDDYQMLKSLKPSTDYVISFDIKSNLGTQGSWVSIQQGDSTNAMLPAAMTHIKGNETWEHIRVFLRSNDTLPKINGQYIYITSLGGVGYSIIKNLKLTEGIVDTPWAPHPEDLEGRGVTEITQWYLATNLSSGVTAGTSGWSTDITTQKITADKKYLWNCHRTKYSDGTMTLISTPAIIGVYGEKGDNAKNLSITPSSQYFKSTDGGKTFAPNQITITPTIQGEINFGKWQYSIDGGVSFADAVSGQKGLTISNNVLTVNKDSSLYSDAVTMVTFRAVASDSSFYDTCSIAKIYDVSDIGDGRNLWITRDNITLQACEKDKYIYTTTGTSAVCIGADVNSVGTNTIALQTGTKYTISFVISSPSEVGYAQWYFCTALNGTAVKNYGGYAVKLVAGENIVSQTITVDTSCDAAGLVIYNLPTGCIIKDIQVEKGSSPTGWSPAPEDIQTAILSTKNSIENVSSKVDTNTKSIQDKVSKTTYETDLKLVKGDLSKANDGLNKWRYEIYPKSLFESEDQGKSTIDIFARNLNLVPTQTVLLDDASLSTGMNYGDNHIAYALTFVKMSTKKDVTTKMFNDDGASLYVNGKLIGSYGIENTSGHDVTFTLARGWNCIEVVVNEEGGLEGFRFSTTLSKLSECQMMNCYYGTPVARQSRITNQLVDVTKNLTGVTSTVQDVMTAVGNSGNITEFKNNYSKWKQSVDKIETRVGEKYVTNEKFNGLEIGGRNLLLNSAFKNDRKNWTDWGTPATRELVTSNNKIWAHIVGNKQNYQGLNQWTESGSIKTGDNITFSARIKGGAANQIFTIGIHWMSSSNTIIDQTWHTFTVGTTDDVYTWTTTASGANCSKLNLMVGVSDTSTAYNVYFTELKLEKGNKATDWTPAPEDDEINGQNLVSNLPSNWEQGSFMDSKTNVGCDYATNKSSMTTRIRVKELVPVSGTITISNAYSNQSKKPIQHWITAFDVNKKWLGASYVSTAWSDFPRIIDVKDAKYIAVIVGYTDNSAITPSDISQICLKIERGTSATPFTLAPEDVNGKIQSIETIATQTADKFSWLVKSGTSSSNFELTDKTATLVASKINQYGLVTFNGLSTDAKNGILNSFEVGGRNLALNTSNSYSTAFTSFSGVENTCFDLGQVTCKGIAIGDVVTVHLYIKYTDIVPASGQTARIWLQGYGNITVWNNGAFAPSEYKAISGSGEFEFLYSFTMSSNMYINTYWTCGLRTDYIASGSIQYKAFKVEKGNKPTDWTPAPEDYLPQANLVSNWTTNTTWIDGGKIYTGSITADKIDVVNLFAQDITASGTIQSKNYTESGGNVTDGSKWVLKDGSFKSKNLSWDLNGNLIAKNANLSGEITATDGSIGKFKITDQWLITGSGSTCAGLGGSGQAFWAGNENSTVAPFRVDYDGKLVSSNADISGKITAINGTIGKYEITDTYLKTGSGSTCSGFGSDYAFWAGNDEAKYAPFRVEYDGTLNIEHITVHGNQEDVYMKIGKDFLTIQDVNTSAHFGLDGFDFAWANSRIRTGDQGIELYGGTPYIDFHYDNSYADYTSRIIAQSNWDCLSFTGSILLGGYIYNSSNGHYTWDGRTDAYLGCGNYNNTNNIYYYAGYHAFYVNGDSGSGIMYIETSGVSSRKGFRNSSDRRIKKNFSQFDDNFIDTYLSLNPVQYQFKNSDDDKYHFGFIAQDTEQVLNNYGQATDKSYGICATHAIDPDKAEKLYGVKDMHEEYSLAYDELIAPTTYMVQHTYKELETLKQEKADLESRIAELEEKFAKLNL